MPRDADPSTQTSSLQAQDADARARIAQSRLDVARFLAPKRGVAYVGSIASSPLHRKFAKLPDDLKLCMVNPAGGEAWDMPVYPSIADLPDDYEAVVIKVGAKSVGGMVEACAARGIPNVIVFSSGFTETGEEGARLERELAATAERVGVRLVGPNTNDNMFWELPIPEGYRGKPLALVTQSGAGGRPILEGVSQGAAVKRWVATGNEVDLDVADFIAFFAEDEEIGAIACYVEGFRSVPKLRVALEIAAKNNKPVVLMKMGSTERGAQLTTSHTGHMAGQDAAIGGLLRQYGVVRTPDTPELLEFANLFSKLPSDTGPRCMLYTYSGGVSTLMGEVADSYGVQMPELADATKAGLQRYLPDYVGMNNPMDNGALIMHEPDPAGRLAVLDLLAADPNVDVIVVGINTAANEVLGGRMCQDLLDWAPTAPKPVVAVWGTPRNDVPAYQTLIASGVPIFRSFSTCFGGLRAFTERQRRQQTFRVRACPDTRLTAAQAAALRTPGTLSATDAATVLGEAGVRMARETVTRSAQEAAAAAAAIGAKTAMKLMSPDFPHKSDAGLVVMDVEPGRAGEVHDMLVARARSLDPKGVIEGVLVQEQIPRGVEMIVGLTYDAQCGPCLAIGAGGVHAELLGDLSIRPLPVDDDDIAEMIAELKLSPLLDGFRGAPVADKAALIRLARAVADLGAAAGPQIAELDLNPVIVLPNGAIAVDALVVAGPAARGDD